MKLKVRFNRGLNIIYSGSYAALAIEYLSHVWFLRRTILVSPRVSTALIRARSLVSLSFGSSLTTLSPCPAVDADSRFLVGVLLPLDTK